MTQRLFPSLVAGAAVAVALFWLMKVMVDNDQAVLEKQETLHMVDFVRMKQKFDYETRERRKPEPKKVERKPVAPKMVATQSDVQAESPDIDMPQLDIPRNVGQLSGSLLSGLSMGRGLAMGAELMPLVRIPPKYPMRAAMDRIEGWVKVEFTITETGAVKDAVVVESKPARVFDRAALRAIVKWKFKPKMAEGRPVQQRALQLLEFKLVK